MQVTPATVDRTERRVADREESVVPLINRVRADLAEAFDASVDPVTTAGYREAVEAVFADPDLAVNVTGLVLVLTELDVPADYPGFVVDELAGRELAAMIAGGQPLRLLAEATFHYADVVVPDLDRPAGADDLDAALAAGFQTRLPGWGWRERPGPFEG